MALDINSSIGDLLKDPKAKAVLEKHLPGIWDNPQMSMVEAMSLPDVSPMTDKIPMTAVKAIEKDLKNL